MRKGGRRVMLGVLCLPGLFVLAACVGTSGPVMQDPPGDPPPRWLDELPVSKEELCAVGVSGPSYYWEDALANSKALALTELARGLEVKIKSHMRIRQSGDSVGRSELTLTEVSDFTTEQVVTLAQVRAQWRNPGGYPTRGEKNTVYTLACMPLHF